MSGYYCRVNSSTLVSFYKKLFQENTTSINHCLRHCSLRALSAPQVSSILRVPEPEVRHSSRKAFKAFFQSWVKNAFVQQHLLSSPLKHPNKCCFLQAFSRAGSYNWQKTVAAMQREPVIQQSFKGQQCTKRLHWVQLICAKWTWTHWQECEHRVEGFAEWIGYQMVPPKAEWMLHAGNEILFYCLLLSSNAAVLGHMEG